jgi:hypothetical protein
MVSRSVANDGTQHLTFWPSVQRSMHGPNRPLTEGMWEVLTWALGFPGSASALEQGCLSGNPFFENRKYPQSSSGEVLGPRKGGVVGVMVIAIPSIVDSRTQWL